MAEAVSHLRSAFATLWQLPWHNVHKDCFWRLTVNGVPWAGGHGLAHAAQTCDCGWGPDAQQEEPLRASAWREHVFWSCPVAQAVAETVQRQVPGELQHGLRPHVWLALHMPGVEPAVWQVVALAALSAMQFGRRVLWAKSRAAEVARAAGGGRRQITIEEAWGLEEAPPVVPVLQQAQRRAVAEFWSLLQSFASMHDGGEGSWQPGRDLSVQHPFLCGRQGERWAVRVRFDGVMD